MVLGGTGENCCKQMKQRLSKRRNRVMAWLGGGERGLTPGQGDRDPHARQEHLRYGADRCGVLRWGGLGKAEHRSDDNKASWWRVREKR